jgi:2,3-bisphosphoglycerate-independent phosphoglycerate mutase
MKRVFFLFLDGVGLGASDPERNPFERADMPHLQSLLDGNKLIAESAPYDGEWATLLSIDTRLGVEGTPQSASGQAAILTGRNIPKEINEHYGPKPNAPIREILKQDNLFFRVRELGGTAALLNAYPPRYFEAIKSGRRLYSAIPMALTAAGYDLMTAQDLQEGRALSADFTGEGWAQQPGFPPAPVYTEFQAGNLMADLAGQFDLALFDYWLSDYVGHRGTMDQAVEILNTFDAVLGGLLENWVMDESLLVMCSDHGNLEDLGKRGHTLNPVPGLIIGAKPLRAQFCQELTDLTGLTPAITQMLTPQLDQVPGLQK